MRRILPLTSLLLAATLITACGEDAEPSTITGADDTSDTVNDTASDDLPLGAGPYPIADLSVSFTDAAGNLAEYRLACLGDTATFTGEVPPGVDAATACLSVATDTARMLLNPNVMVDRTEIYGVPKPPPATLDGIEVNYDQPHQRLGIDDWERVFADSAPPRRPPENIDRSTRGTTTATASPAAQRASCGHSRTFWLPVAERAATRRLFLGGDQLRSESTNETSARKKIKARNRNARDSEKLRHRSETADEDLSPSATAELGSPGSVNAGSPPTDSISWRFFSRRIRSSRAQFDPSRRRASGGLLAYRQHQ